MAGQRVIDGADGLAELLGEELGVSDWRTVDQADINSFGRITGDEQWIHTDPTRAAEGPFGTTIAHGFLVLSLIPMLANQIYEVQGFAARVNYGLEKVRFPQPLRAGEKVRDRVTVRGVERTPAGARVTFSHEIESSGGGRPVCVAQTVTLFTLG
ncbi:MaoC family dehydratase [Arthrobacter sp. NPDC058097]|uniref:MaoC family dehydratase n=1 Tax=Arthrobacter sp. NPDC058097 TaxID=3346340 RepID=UPI0036DA1F92